MIFKIIGGAMFLTLLIPFFPVVRNMFRELVGMYGSKLLLLRAFLRWLVIITYTATATWFLTGV